MVSPRPRFGRRRPPGLWQLGWVGLAAACGTATPEPAVTPSVSDVAQGISAQPIQLVIDTTRHPPLADKANGAAIADLDGDGDEDVVFANDGTSLQLLWNQGGWFVDGTVDSGLADVSARSASGVVVVDVDGDGFVDLFVTRRYTRNHLLLGDGAGHFRLADWGMEDKDVHDGASFGDLDLDGDLDAMVAVSFDPARNEDRWEGGLNGAPNRVYLNQGDHFTDGTASTGLAGTPTGESFGSVIFDVDGDLAPDVFMVHDRRRDQFFQNDGAGHFTERLDWVEDTHTGLMGLDVADMDEDGDLDIYSTDFGFDDVKLQDANAPLGTARFTDRSAELFAGSPDPSGNLTGWGCALVDVDNDGDVDALTTSAFADSDGVFRDGRMTLIENLLERGTLRLADASEASGPVFGNFMHSYGLSVGDLDGDGDQDAAVGITRREHALSQPPNTHLESLILWNVGQRAAQNASLTLELRQPGKNTRAIGAVVTVEAGGRRQKRVLLAGSSYLSSIGPLMHFGLGSAQVATRVEILWPDGAVSTAADVPAGRHVVTRPPGR